jgi:phage FluMu gp28-like protein
MEQTQAVADPARRIQTLIVVKRTEAEFQDWIATEPGFLTTFGSYDEEPIQLEPYQLAFMSCDAPFRSVEKSRQVGYSWMFAGETLARSHLRDQYTGIFVSYNLADAKEKIAYVQQMHEELPLEFQKKKVTDSKLEIAFQSNGAHRRVSRIISNPSKAPRGKKGDIYLDELAHCSNDKEIYKGSTALIIRATGSQLTVCSSPLGRRGVFWEIARQEIKPYPGYWRQAVPWWLCSIMCKDIVLASREAPKMQTADRVARFGTKKIKDQFEALLIEDFQEEFECVYSDETLTFFPYELIIPCTDPDAELCEDFADVRKKAKGRLVAAYDVGRKRDRSELTIWDDRDYEIEMMLARTYERTPFADQKNDLIAMMTILPIARLSIDNTGIGMNLAEDVEAEFPAAVVREDFTSAVKEVWCTDFKIGLQKKRIKMPRERDLIAQIHSIKKNVTPGGRVTFDAERDAKGHADKFWSCAMACRKERGELQVESSVRARVFG